MPPNKRPLAFLLGISGNLGFAAGNVALSINKYMPTEEYDIVIYFSDLNDTDKKALQKIPNVRLVPFKLAESFVELMLERLPQSSRFRNRNHLMCFCHFEAFKLLSEYRTVAWLDADIAVQASLAEIVKFSPIGITADVSWTVQANFSEPIPNFDMNLPGMCTAVMVVHDTLPYEEIYRWCYDKAVEYAHALVNPDQAIINLLLQAFKVAPNEMPYEEWQCIFWRDQASSARIVHFGTENKVWSNSNVFNSFPEWQRVHLQWLQLGGSDIDWRQVRVRNPVRALNELDELARKGSVSEEVGKRQSKPKSPPLKKMNRELRRIFLGAPAHKAANSSAPSPAQLGITSDRPLIAFKLRGGLGDHLVAARFIRDLIAEVGEFKFDLFSSRPEHARWIFSNYRQLRRIYTENLEWDLNMNSYSLPIFLQQYVYLYVDRIDPRAAFERYTGLAAICDSIQRSRYLIEDHIAKQPHTDNFMAQQAVLRGWNRTNVAHNMAGLRYRGHRLELPIDHNILPKYNLIGANYITIHNSSDENFMVGNVRMGDKVSTKVYPRFEALVACLRDELPALKIVQLGATNSKPIIGVSIDLRGKCSIEETAAVLAKSALHIDVESGLVHLAACLGAKSCVLFGPTSIEYFGYEGNINIPPATCGNCWWLTPDWMVQCARGFRTAKCLDDISPETVVKALMPHLRETLWSAKAETRGGQAALESPSPGVHGPTSAVDLIEFSPSASRTRDAVETDLYSEAPLGLGRL